jgi:iron(III) transport system permease protein
MTMLVKTHDGRPTIADPRAGRSPRRLRRRRREVGIRIAIAICCAFVIAGSVYPTVSVLSAALSSEALPRYVDFVTSSVQWAVLRNTLVLGTLVGAIGTGIGFLFAFVQTRLAVPFKRTLHIMALVPIVSPPFAIAFAAICLYGRRGVISYDLLEGLARRSRYG